MSLPRTFRLAPFFAMACSVARSPAAPAQIPLSHGTTQEEKPGLLRADCTTTAETSIWIEDTGFHFVKNQAASFHLTLDSSTMEWDIKSCAFTEAGQTDDAVMYREAYIGCSGPFKNAKRTFVSGVETALFAKSEDEIVLSWADTQETEDSLSLVSEKTGARCDAFLSRTALRTPQEPEAEFEDSPAETVSPLRPLLPAPPVVRVTCRRPDWFPSIYQAETVQISYDEKRHVLRLMLDQRTPLRSEGPCTLWALESDGKTETPLSVTCGDPETPFSLSHGFEPEKEWTISPFNGRVSYGDPVTKTAVFETIPGGSFCAAAPLSVAQPFRKPQP